MIHLAVSFLALLAVVGVLANNYRRRWCFYLWWVSNSGYMLVDLFYTGLPERALQHGVFLALAVHGYRQWGRQRQWVERAEKAEAEADLWQARYDRLLGACAELRVWVETQKTG